MKAAVIGAGTMGNGIAHVFAQYGFQVKLIDQFENKLENALETIQQNLDKQIEKAIISADTKSKILKNLSTAINISQGVRNADIVIEAVHEDVSLKQNIFKQLSKNTAENCILASNTSSISVTKLAAATEKPDKVIGMHFMNPVPVMRLVEIIKGYDTSATTISKIIETVKTLNKTPVEVKDYPGFVSNRILMPMINEAIFSLYEHIGSVETIDQVMYLGMNHPMGPLKLADFIGLDVCQSILNILYEGFKNPKYAACPLLNNMVMAGHLGVKSGTGFYDWQDDDKNPRVSERFKDFL